MKRLIILALVTLGVGPGLAEPLPTFLRSCGERGTLPGQFLGPRDVAVGPTGDIYVADTNNNRIQKLDHNCGPLTSWGMPGSGDGEFHWPWGIAIDAGGLVYVADRGNHRVQKFDADGAFLQSWPISGDPFAIAVHDGRVFIADLDGIVYIFDSLGQLQQQWRSGPVSGIAVSPNGHVVLAEWGNRRVAVYGVEGTLLSEWGSMGGPGGTYDGVLAITVRENGNIYVTDEVERSVQVFDGTGAFLGIWGGFGAGPGQFDIPGGLEWDQSGVLHVADIGNCRIQQFGIDTVMVLPYSWSLVKNLFR